MTPAEYVDALEQCGWFIGLPGAARSDTVAEVAEAISDGHEPPLSLGTPMLNDDSDDPRKILAVLAETSYGLFEASAIDVVSTDSGSTIHFDIAGQRHSIDWPDESTGWENLIGFANGIVSGSSSGLRFLQIADDECGSLVLTNVPAFKKAQELELIPKMPGEGDELEGHDIEASARARQRHAHERLVREGKEAFRIKDYRTAVALLSEASRLAPLSAAEEKYLALARKYDQQG